MPTDPRNQVVSTFHLRRRTPGSFLLVPCPRQGRQGQLEGAAATILVACPAVAHIQEGQREFCGMLKKLDESLPLAETSSPANAYLAGRFYLGSRGVLECGGPRGYPVAAFLRFSHRH